ncbi:hypothetical protein TNCV_4133121 [Trichonephila clavipes]|nr:hypothetical protein TNCV_4133121 [Trichonephila clavipes]
MWVLVHIDITQPHTPLPVFRGIGERTIPYSWRAWNPTSRVIIRLHAKFGVIAVRSNYSCSHLEKNPFLTTSEIAERLDSAKTKHFGPYSEISSDRMCRDIRDECHIS